MPELDWQAALAGKSEAQLARREHVERVAAEHQVEVREGDYHGRRGGVADIHRRVVRLGGKLHTPKGYATALHEIGHIVGPWQGLSRMDQETGAWLWALDHRDPDLWVRSSTMQMVHSLDGYTRRLVPGSHPQATALVLSFATRRLPVPDRCPPKTIPAWAVWTA